MSSSDLASFFSLLFNVLTFLVLGRALLSWFDPTGRTTIGQLLIQITEPLLSPVRDLLRRLLPNTGMIDLSPIVLIIGLQLVSRLLVQSLQ
jgi:YggT family protein